MIVDSTKALADAARRAHAFLTHARMGCTEFADTPQFYDKVRGCAADLAEALTAHDEVQARTTTVRINPVDYPEMRFSMAQATEQVPPNDEVACPHNGEVWAPDHIAAGQFNPRIPCGELGQLCPKCARDGAARPNRQAPPSDKEIMAWRVGARGYLCAVWSHIRGGKLPNRLPTYATKLVDDAVALMRRGGSPAPAPEDQP